MLMSVQVKAQKVQLKGLVTTEDGTILPGVTIAVNKQDEKKTQTHSTNGKGQFVIPNLVAGKYDFTLSYVGYKTAIIKSYAISSGDDNFLSVKMKDSSVGMNEVVLVGFSSQKKINVTGAIDQISVKEIARRPVANVLQALQGISPGLNITYPGGGKPGAVPAINIRGAASINGGTPLFVIDGIVSSTDDLLRLNPADIASLSVLKDAASAAIYGARAAFGVVLVTTKIGTGRQTISYAGFVTSSKPTLLPDPVTDPYIYAKTLATATSNTPWNYISFTDDQYKWARQRSDDPTVADTRLDPNDPTKWAYMGNNNWYDYFLNKNSLSQSHSISLSGTAGASETGKKQPLSYYLSANYTNENGLNKLAKDDWDRYVLKSRIVFSPLSWLKLDNNLSLYQTVTSNPSNSLTNLYYLRPLDVAKNPDGSWANTGAGRLGAQLVNGGNNKNNVFGFQNIARATASFLNNDLQITADASIKREMSRNTYNYTPYNIGWGPADIRQEGGKGSVYEGNGSIKDDVYDVYANYNKTFKKHGLRLLAGFNQEEFINPYVLSERDVLITSSLPYLGLTTGSNFVTPSYSSFATRSWFGRVGYSYMDKYIVEGNGRYDGSSRFPSKSRFGFFPSVSAAWIANKENFLKGITDYIPTLKFRASYGSLGNQNVGNFDYIQTLPTTLSPYLIDGSRQTVIGNSPSLKIDPNNYTWEKVNTSNIGVDVGILKNKITFSFDYYIRNTTRMLTAGEQLPGTLGTSVPLQNAADLRTKGWELSTTYRDVFTVASKPLYLNMRFTLSDSRAWITKFKNDQQLFSNYRVGQELGEIWGLQNDGLFRTAGGIAKLDESAIIPWGALQIVNGWPKYKDRDGNGKIEVGLSAKDPKDLAIIGNSSPRYMFGYNMDANWNGLDVSMFLQGVAKMNYYPHHYLFWGPYQQPYAGLYKWNLNYYRENPQSAAEKAQNSKSYNAAGLSDANPNPEFPVLQAWLADNNYGAGLDIPQTKYLQNAAYLRVKNVTLGYTLPADLLKKLKMSRLRFYISGENLFEISAIKQYIDPEAVNTGAAWIYPFQRKYAVGINLDF